MAEAAETQTESKGSKKTLILFGVALLVAIGASVGGTIMFLGVGDETAPEAAVAPTPDKAIYHSLRPAFIINYVTGSKPRFLQAELTVMARNPAVIEAMIDHMPLVRSSIVTYLTDQDFFELQTQAGKESLREGIRALVDELLLREEQIQGVESVLLTNFVLQ
ncbi:MAG: flagellar basal body-associated FliL family protein [Pseudomonadales bacterium]